MKKIFVILFSACLSMGAMAQSTLTFNANAGVKSKMTVYTGRAPKVITDLDMQRYLNYVVSTQALKGVPAFDSQIEGINSACGENEEFGGRDSNGYLKMGNVLKGCVLLPGIPCGSLWKRCPEVKGTSTMAG